MPNDPSPKSNLAPTPPFPAGLPLELQSHLRRQTLPGQGEFFGCTLPGIAAAAGCWECSPLAAMQKLLRDYAVWPLRFARNRGVMSAEEQAFLLSRSVAVIGCGGLGGHVATLLARLGVGGLTLCDHDRIDESNLNRQLLAQEHNIGMNKAEAAARAVAGLASHVELRIFTEPATPANLPEILAGNALAVDCLDSIAARLEVEAAAHALAIPFVHGSVAGEEGFVMVSRRGGKALRLLFPDAAVSRPAAGAETVKGVPTLTPAVVAALEAHLAWRELLGRRDFAEFLWHVDLAGLQITRLEL